MNPIRKKLTAGEVLYREGDASNSFFVVLNGVISLFNERAGKAIEKARLTNNHIVGSLTYFHSTPRTSSARAVVDCELVEFPYSEIQNNIKVLPGWVQLMLKSFGEQLHEAHKELEHLQNQNEGSHLSADDILRCCASLRIALQSLEAENSSWDWGKVREYAFQVFQIPALKLEPLAAAFVSQGWLGGESGETGLARITKPNLERMLVFESFVRKYKSSRTKRAMIEVVDSDLVAISALIGAADCHTDHKGTSTIELNKALTFAQALPGGSGFRVDQFDLLLKKGLDVLKESTESGVRVSFNLSEMKAIKDNWSVLAALLTL
jgi:CRP-like cAMP-binding protein